MGIWGQLDIRIDPWDADYGASTAFEGFADDETRLELNLEREDWCAIGAQNVVPPERWVFIDGIRRIDARVVALKPDGELLYGLFGTYGVGAVGIANGRATIGVEEVDRVVVTGSAELGADVVRVMKNLVYRPISTPRTDAEAPLVRLQTEMRLAEARLAKASLESDALVVSDGPLAHKDLGAGVVGYVKRIFDPYLPKAHAPFLASLPAKHRTPVFAIHGGNHSRFAWFLRLSEPAKGHSPYAGVVRLEVDGSIGISEAVRLADLTCVFLPKLASSRTFDPRAPQNLIPVGALETHLRHLLGDSTLIRRAIEAKISEGLDE